MADGWTVAWAIHEWRRASGRTLRDLVRETGVATGTLSNWERGRIAPTPDQIEQLGGNAVPEDELGAVCMAIRRSLALSPDRHWAANPEVGPLWGWFRAERATRATLRWGPWRLVVDVPPGPAGVAVSSPVGLMNPPIFVTFDDPGRFDLLPGRPPAWLQIPVLDGFQLLEPDELSHPTLLRLARVLGGVAPRTLEASVGLARGVGRRLLSHSSRVPASAPAVVPANGTDVGTRCDGELFVAMRRACNLGSGKAAKLAEAHLGRRREEASRGGGTSPGRRRRATRRVGAHALETPSLTVHQARALAGGGGRAEAAAAFDSYFGVGGRLVRGVTDWSARDTMDAHFLWFWRGPVWVTLRPRTDPDPLVRLEWSGLTKVLAPEGPCTITCHKSELGTDPLSVRAQGWLIEAGVGLVPGAADVNPRWDLSAEVHRESFREVASTLLREHDGAARLIRQVAPTLGSVWSRARSGATGDRGPGDRRG